MTRPKTTPTSGTETRLDMIAKNLPSSFPVLTEDGAVLSLSSDGTEVLAHCQIQLSHPTAREIAIAQSGTLQIGHIRVVSGSATCAVFLFKFGTTIVEAPFALGLERAETQEHLLQALDHVDDLTLRRTWGMTVELVDRNTNTSRSVRLVGLSPAFWRSLAGTLRDSRHTTAARHDEMLRRLYTRYPDPALLFRKATNVETFSR